VTTISAVTTRLRARFEAVEGVFGRRSRARLVMTGLITTFAVVTVYRMINAAALGSFAVDLRIYRLAADAGIHGGDPWAASVIGFTFAGPPPSLLPYVPAAIVPEGVAIAIYGALSVGAAVLALRTLGLPLWWLLFPPISESLIVLNPDVIVIALLLAVPRLAPLAVLCKVYAAIPLAIAGRWIALAVGLGLCLLSAPFWPAFFAHRDAIGAALVAQSYGGASAWGTWLLVPTVVALVWLRRRGAEWLAVPAVWPYTQLHYAALALPIAARDSVVAYLLAFPLPFVAPIATIYYAVRLWGHARLGDQRADATKTDPSPSR
jgi:hypothetical protein